MLLRAFVFPLLMSFRSLIQQLPESYGKIFQDVKREINFNTFLITGGLCAMGNGTIQILTYVFHPFSALPCSLP